jgi:hypothetical protein
MSQLEHSPKKSVRIASAIAVAAVVAVLGAVAVDAQSRFSPLESSASVTDQAVRPAVVSTQSSDNYYYFPAQFKEPEGAPAEPVDTF